MDHCETIYILATNQITLALYKESKEVLMTSNSYDFMVFKFANWDEVLEDLEEWEDYISIDESTYNALHSNLCKKLRALI